MKKYNSDYVYVTSRDSASSFILFKIAGYDSNEYIDENYKPKEKAMSTVLFKMINKEEIDGFDLVYSDSIVSVYKMG